jgi:S1-C subfamily serine protease
VLKGDLLTSAGGVALSRVADLHQALAVAKPGESLRLELVRGTEERQVVVTLAEEPELGEQEARRQRFHRRH